MSENVGNGPTCEYPASWKRREPVACGAPATHIAEDKPLCEEHALHRFWRTTPVSLLLPPLREAVNVADLKKRDRLIRRRRKIRADAVLEKNTIEYWNRQHPTESRISTAFEDALIAWCDGRGPMPTKVPDDGRCSA